MTPSAGPVARRLLAAVSPRLPSVRRPPRLTILCYHLVGGGTDLAVDVRAETFRAQMEELAAACRAGRVRVTSLAEAVDRLRASAKRTGSAISTASPDARESTDSTDSAGPTGLTDSPEPHWVVLTFDDAYDNFSARAWPVLEELGLPSTLFVPVGFVDGATDSPIAGHGLEPLTWERLEELRASGLLEVGSHTWSHRDLRRLGRDELLNELRISKTTLEDRLETEVRAFCYPQGFWSRRIEPCVGQVYELATIGGGWTVTRSSLDPLRLWRIPMLRHHPPRLQPFLRAPVWLEEWIADKARRSRRDRRNQRDRTGRA